MAGHSAGGLYVREYAREFPTEVAAVVLIDSTSPLSLDEVPGFRASYEQDKRNATREMWEDRLLVWSGWERIVGHCSVSPKDFLDWTGQYDAMACRPQYVDTDESELSYFEQSCEDAARLISFGKIPLLIVSRDPDLPRAGMTGCQIARESVWNREQEELKSLSPLSWRVIAHGSGHMVPQNRPDVIIREINLLISYLRGGPEPPFGSTTIN
jgi:pimeloyl-ACP methyl ester carboxylesterase